MRTASMIVAAAIAAVAVPQGGAVAFSATRPAADMARDAARKPQVMIAFARVKPGETVVELVPGSGYFTRVFSDAVGPKGKVISIVPSFFGKEGAKSLTTMQALAAEPGRGNVVVKGQPLTDLAPAGSVNLVWTSQNYHDLHNPSLPADTVPALNKAAFRALKPGGLYVIEDHVAPAGSGVSDVATLHRIDPAVVKQEVTAAGFVFDGSSKALANPADDHSKKIFDPAIRGHTDQFVFRFRKPG